jgi:ech hydrogenase subunit B
MSWILALTAPLWGGLIYGVERKMRARMQRRKGPPLLQPFYDMIKLMEKRTSIIHTAHAMLAVAHFFTLWLVVAALFMGWNLLYIIFLHLAALILLVMAGYSVRSPYSHLGANRELLALVAYEPIMIMTAVGFYLVSGSFDIAVIMEKGGYLSQMPLLLAAFLIIVPLKVKKSPFDTVEGHQEIVGGVEVEYSGLFYEFLYMARFLEYIFVYGVIFLFGGAAWWLGLLLAVAAFAAVNVVDNATARVRSDQMLKIVYATAFALATLNLIWLV